MFNIFLSTLYLHISFAIDIARLSMEWVNTNNNKCSDLVSAGQSSEDSRSYRDGW